MMTGTRLKKKKKREIGNSLAFQWLGLQASTAKGLGLVSGQGPKIPRGMAKKKKKTGNEKLTRGSVQRSNRGFGSDVSTNEFTGFIVLYYI